MSVNAYDPATDSLILLAAGKKDSRSTLTVTTELPSLIGETVTVTDNKETLTSTFSNDGRAVFKLNNMGTYTASCKTYSNSIINENPGMNLELLIGPKIVSWSTGTDAEIVALIAAADLGDVDLYEDAGWRVGDERTIHLSAMSAMSPLADSYEAQDIDMVLMSRNHFTLVTPKASGKTTCDFVVGQKKVLSANYTSRKTAMNGTRVTTGGWNSCARKTWCDTTYKNAFPSSIIPIFKQFYAPYNQAYNSSTLSNSTGYFALYGVVEVLGASGKNVRCCQGEQNETSQFEYFSLSASNQKQYDGSLTNLFSLCRGRTAIESWEEFIVVQYRLNDTTNSSSLQADGQDPSSYPASVAPIGCI